MAWEIVKTQSLEIFRTNISQLDISIVQFALEQQYGRDVLLRSFSGLWFYYLKLQRLSEFNVFQMNYILFR